jgi:hypothetical protein
LSAASGGGAQRQRAHEVFAPQADRGTLALDLPLEDRLGTRCGRLRIRLGTDRREHLRAGRSRVGHRSRPFERARPVLAVETPARLRGGDSFVKRRVDALVAS